jgi:UDP-N-acetylmuramyl pentapeptide phosphotransferase/UDP-N-acetylglucosamine-1-phosphate transferase
MPPTNDLPSASIGLAVGVSMIAVFLGLRQWYERRARDPELSDADGRHFTSQDLRRNLGVGIMLTIAAILLVTSRLEPRIKGQANLIFAELWVVILALIVVLLILALIDWLAIRRYALRHRRTILRESVEAIRREARQAVANRSKQPSDGPSPPHSSPPPPST